MSQNSINKSLLRTVSALTLLCAAHTGAMMKLEKMSLQDSIWLTFTTAATVGYGDLSAKTLEGRLATGGLLFIGGIAVFAQTASLIFARNQLIRDNILNGKRKWKMSDHIVILNAPKENQTRFFKKMMTELRDGKLPGSDRLVIVVSPDLKDGLPDDLRKMGIAHVNENVIDPEGFMNSCLGQASTIVVLSKDQNDPNSDSITYDQIVRAREANPHAVLVAEATEKSNTQRFLAAGATNIVSSMLSSPVLLARTILVPGMEKVIEDFTDSHGCQALPIFFPRVLKDEWGKVANNVMDNMGTAFAYIGPNNETITNPHPRSSIEAKALLVLTRADNTVNPDQMAKILLNAAPA